MSNEELIAILDKYDSRSQTNPNYYSENEVLSAMREACEKEAKEFVGWYTLYEWYFTVGEYYKSYHPNYIQYRLNMDEVYQLYLQYKTKTS